MSTLIGKGVKDTVLEGVITIDNNTSSDVVAVIAVNANVSSMCQYTIPAGRDGWISSIKGAAIPATDTGVISIYATPNGGLETELDFLPLGESEFSRVLLHVAEKTDIVLRAQADQDDTDVKGSFELFVM